MAGIFLVDPTANGNDWDIVSPTASTNAAFPSYGVPELNSIGPAMPVFGGGAPRTMFVSDHFVFPPSEHENLPLEPDTADHVKEETVEEGSEHENLPLEPDTEEGSVSGEYDEHLAELGTLNESFGETNKLVEEESFQTKVVEVSAKTKSVSLDPSNSEMVKDDKLQPDIPSVSWWKQHAASVCSNAKESNLFWSVFLAAAATCVVIIGKRCQLETWQVLQLKLHLHLHVNDEKISMLLGQLTRLKDAASEAMVAFHSSVNSAPIDH